MHLHSFDLRLVIPFTVLADELQFLKAAARLGTAQPALSQQVARLEHQVGASLFNREARRVTLTTAGARFLVGSRAIMARAARIEAELGEGKGELCVHLGAVEHPIVRDVFASFAAAHPSILVGHFEGLPNRGMQALLDGEVDIGFDLPEGVPPGMGFAGLARHPLGVVCAATHPLAAGPSARWTDLDGEPVFVAPPDAADGYNARVRTALRRTGARPVEVIGPRVSHGSYLTSTIVTGRGLLICGEYVIDPLPAGLAWVPLTPREDVEIGVVWNDEDSPAVVRRFVSWARSRASGGLPLDPYRTAPVPAGLPTFDLRLVPSFVAVAEEQHFGRAADRLSVKQSGLSKHISRLELQLGVRLLDRSSREVELTGPGEQFLAAASDILQNAARAEAAVRSERSEIPEITKITIHLGDGLNPQARRAASTFSAAHPSARVAVHTGTPPDASRAVVAGTADVGFDVLEGVPAGLGYTAFDHYPLGVATSPRHRLAGQVTASWQDLAGETLFMARSVGDGGSTAVRTALRQQDVSYRDVDNPMPSGDLLDAHILAGAGLFVGPAFLFSMRPTGVVWTPLHPVVNLQFGWVWNEQTTDTTTLGFVAGATSQNS